MILSSIFTIISLVSCMSQDKQTNVLQDGNHVDSVVVAYFPNRFLSFADIKANEIAYDFQQNRLPSFCIRNQDTIRSLTERVACLVSAQDSLNQHIDARVLLIFYKSASKNDSLYVSVMSQQHLQLNNITKKPDSLLWVRIRDIICDRDSIFSHVFKDELLY